MTQSPHESGSGDVAVLYVGDPDDDLPDRIERTNSLLSVDTVSDAAAAIEGLQRQPDCLVYGRAAAAVDFVEVVRARDQEVPVIVVGDTETIETRPVLEAGATDVVSRGTEARAELLARRIEDTVNARLGAKQALAARRAARHELEQSRARFRALIENSPAAVVVLDSSGAFQYATPAVEELAGYAPRDLVGDVAFDYIHPEDRERVEHEFARGLEDATYTPTVHHRFRHADGHWLHLESRGRNLLDDPAVEGVIINVRDVTDYRRVERRLRRERDLNERFLEVSPHPVVVLDREGRITRANDDLTEQVDVSRADLRGLDMGTPGLTARTLDGEDVPPERTVHGQVVEHGEHVRDVTHEVTLPNGARYRATIHGAPLFTNGEVTHVVLSFDDITELDAGENDKA